MSVAGADGGVRIFADDPFYAAVLAAWQQVSNACVVACTCRSRERQSLPQPNTIMTRAPWGG